MKSTIITILGVAGTFFIPLIPLLLTMIAFIALDSLTAIYVSWKINGRSSIKSHYFFAIVPKTFLYCSTIQLGFLLDNFLIGSNGLLGVKLALCKAMLFIWTVNEISSLNENSMKLGNRSFWVIISDTFSRLKGLKKDLDSLKGEDNK
jgi:hypothetical protein